MSDEAILAELGERLARHRLNRNLTQAEVAREAGVARRTVSKVENGHVVDSRSLARILRALGLLGGLDALVASPRPSPVALAEGRGRVRKRARRRAGSADDSGEWTWPDQEK
jgi:putative transcriptional regulator